VKTGADARADSIKGLDAISPVPLDPPAEAPPPPELASLHFSDFTLAFERFR
jgi:hypothetical protein